MNANPSTNFDQARQAVSSGASMQSSFVAVPGASSSVPSPSINFPAATSAPPLPGASVDPAAQPAPPIPDVSMQAALPPPIPDVSMQAALPPSASAAPTFDVNATPFSSATTPPFPPSEPPPPPPPAQKAKNIFAKKWSLSRKVAVALMVTLAVVAVALFFYSYLSRRRSPSGSAATSPTDPKDITIHLAQGSVLELQGLKDAAPQNPGADLSALKTDLATMQKTLDSIDSNQKAIESSLEGWDDWQPKDSVPSSRKDKPPRSNGAPASAPASAAASAPASRLLKTVRYSADLATQTAEADRDNGKNTNARWASGASTRFYGEAHSSPMHFSTFPSLAPQGVHV